MKVGMVLCLGHIVLDGDLAPPKGAQPPIFWPMSVVAKRLDELRCHLVWQDPPVVQPIGLCLS